MDFICAALFPFKVKADFVSKLSNFLGIRHLNDTFLGITKVDDKNNTRLSRAKSCRVHTKQFDLFLKC
jgi:hypothetical protein